MRVVSESSMLRTLAMPGASDGGGSLIDDCFGELSQREQRGDAAHRLGMSETEEAAGRERGKQRFGGLAPREVVEVNEKITTEHDVEAAIRHVLRRFQEI